jgi:glycerol-3-phosphate dehydrogenase
VTALERSLGRVAAAVVEDVITTERFRVRFRAVVNATGPCVDLVRALEDASAAPLVRLSKGIHAVTPLAGEWQAGLALVDDSGTAIAIPWQGMLLLGATDTPHEANPTQLSVAPAEVKQLLERFANVLPREQLQADRVVYTFAGLRALPHGDVTTERARRRHIVAIGSGGMVSVAGGKLTTHCLIAMDALRHLPTELRLRRRAPRRELLGNPCSKTTEALLHTRLDADIATHMIRLYGEDAKRVAAYRHAPKALDRINPHGPDIWAQVDYAVDQESALSVADILERRTTLAVRGLASKRIVDAVRERLGNTRRSVDTPMTRAATARPRRSSVGSASLY